MKKIVIAGEKYSVSENSYKFLEKYLQKMKNFIDDNNIEIEVYDDIEERISERFNDSMNSSTKKEISDKIIVDIVNEIGEPSEIFKDLIDENESEKKNKKYNFKKHFSNKNKQITRNSKKGIFFGVCYGLGERFQIDPLWIRLLFIVGVFFGGVSIIIYIALIFLLPNEKNNKNNEDIIDEVQDVTNDLIKNLKTATKKIKNESKKSFSKENSDGIDKKEKNENYLNNYNNKSSNFIIRFFRAIFDFIRAIIVYCINIAKAITIFCFKFVKNGLILAFHSSRVGISILLLIICIPVLLAFLFISGFTFTNFVFDNQSLFLNIHSFLKIGLVGIISSFAFITMGISLKLLKGRLLANTLLLSGIIGLFFFIFVGSVGFFNTLGKYTNTYTKTEIFEFDNKEVVLDNLNVFGTNNNDFINGVNWIQRIDFRSTDGEKLKIEVKSFINSKNKFEADMIFGKLTKIKPKISPNIDFGLENKNSFTGVVPFSFLRREITFYIPKDVSFKIGSIRTRNINYVSSLYYKDGENIYGTSRLNRECRESILQYLEEKKGFLCIDTNQ